jgi:plasmid stabilization system protein ParE
LIEVVWTDTALETYLKVIDFLFDFWSNKEVKTFEKKVDNLIQNIVSFNQLCPESKLLGYRKCIIDKHNSLIYHVIKNKLILVTFIDNRSQHSY